MSDERDESPEPEERRPSVPQRPDDAPPPAPAAPTKSPGMGAGFGLGCAAYVLGVPIMLASASAMAAAGAFGVLWPFILIAVVSALLMISERTRRVGTGMLIASAAAWIIVIGPCVGLLGGFG